MSEAQVKYVIKFADGTYQRALGDPTTSLGEAYHWPAHREGDAWSSLGHFSADDFRRLRPRVVRVRITKRKRRTAEEERADVLAYLKLWSHVTAREAAIGIEVGSHLDLAARRKERAP